MSKRVRLGKIATAHGIKGLVKLQVSAEDPRLLDGNPLYSSPSGGAPVQLKLKNPIGKFWLAEIEGITDRNQAEALRGTELWLDCGLLPEPEEGEFYYADLIGLDVADIAGNPVGKVIAVANFGAGDLLEIKPESQPSFYLPFQTGYVHETDLDRKLVVVTIPDGLL